jgi:two-component system chemotaxis sensor kinase CheA
MEDLLQDFLVEATDLLSDVDNKLVGLEKNPSDKGLLNDIFRGFHTIKGGAGFLNATELVTLCHLTENLFDLLRNGQIAITPVVMDSIMDATGTVRDMFGSLEQGTQPGPASAQLLGNLRAAIAGEAPAAPVAAVVAAAPATATPAHGLDWTALHGAVASEAATIMETPAVPAVLHTDVAGKSPEQIIQQAMGRRATDTPGTQNVGGRREVEKSSSGGGGASRSGGGENSIRVDTTRLDQVLNLSGEIGLTKNRLNSLRSDILNGRNDSDTLHALDQAVSQLDLLVSDLQNAVMKTRMQPIGRLFQKYPRIARDLARNLGKDVELVLVGEETEIDKTMIEDLSDPIIHLIRNAVDHGIEPTADRLAAGKSPKSEVRLEARQEGDHILLLISDDGRGMNPEKLRAKAVEKGLISDEEANVMDERQSYNLVFLPGFSTKDAITDVSGRGVGMDVVKTNIQKLNGSIETKSALGKGTTFIISLPLTLAILPVLLVQLDQQPFAVPLSMVREILPINVAEVQEVGGRATMVVRGEVMPIYPLSYMLGWAANHTPGYGVLMQTAEQTFILAIDGFMGREDAVIKSLDDFRPKGVAGVTTLSNGQIVLILDIKELLSDLGDGRGVPRSIFQTAISAAA